MARFGIDFETLLGLASGSVEVAASHQLFAPALVRSQALAALYDAAHRGEISAAEGLVRISRLHSASLKVRFLETGRSKRAAWKIAVQLGWEQRTMPSTSR